MISPAAASVFFDVIWADDVELALPSLSLVTKMARRMDDPDSLRLRRGSLNETPYSLSSFCESAKEHHDDMRIELPG